MVLSIVGCFQLFGKINTNKIFSFAALEIHLGFSAMLKIWQVPACKMEPQSGYIMQLEIFL